MGVRYRLLRPIEFIKRAGLPRVIEWAIVSWMYLWIAGFVVAILVGAVRGYVGVFMEARAYERSLSRAPRGAPSGLNHAPSTMGGGHAHDSTHGDTG